jgi:hypothetical protein
MALEQVLFVHKELDVYKIPPRVGASGWRSGEWRVNDKIFTGRCRVVAQGPALEVRLEDPQTGELFGVAPVPPGQSQIAVEQASDSSRNFVLRLEDAASKRHAFVGISFAERSTAFDFNVAIQDHERQQKRAEEMQKISASQDPLAAASELMPEAAALYRSAGDLSLKEGETIKINVKKKEHASGDGDSFLARLVGSGATAAGSSAAAPGRLVPLAPPPGEPAGILPPPPAATAAAPSGSSVPAAAPPPPQPAAGLQDLLGWGAPAAPAAAAPAPGAEDGWATFD